MSRKAFVSVKDAAARIGSGTRFIDARWSLKDLGLGKKQYAESRIQGACFFDLEKLSGAMSADTGRHPLPTFSDWQQWLSLHSLKPTDSIVAYDGMSGQSAACRVWWMLRVSGYPNVSVLAGGLPAWEKEGLPIDTAAADADAAASSAEPVVLPVSEWPAEATVDQAFVEGVAKDGGVRLLDARSAERYGSTEETGPGFPDQKVGHIPTARNHAFSANYDAAGIPLGDEALKRVCEATLDGAAAADSVVYCGSGVTACCTVAAMDQAGLGMPKIFVGSWSQWQKSH